MRFRALVSARKLRPNSTQLHISKQYRRRSPLQVAGLPLSLHTALDPLLRPYSPVIAALLVVQLVQVAVVAWPFGLEPVHTSDALAVAPSSVTPRAMSI